MDGPILQKGPSISHIHTEGVGWNHVDGGKPIDGDLVPSLGDGKNFAPKFINDFFSQTIFYRFSQSFYCVWIVIYNKSMALFFFTRKTSISERNFFLLSSYFRTHPTNTTSQNIEGTDAWADPTSNFGDSPLQVSAHGTSTQKIKIRVQGRHSVFFPCKEVVFLPEFCLSTE